MSQTPELIIAYSAEGEIKGYRIVAFGEEKESAKQATAATDKLIGISTRVPKDPGEHVDVVRGGLYPVMYGGDIKRGDCLTTDAQGRAVKATAKQAYIGFAEEDGVEGDLGSLFIVPGFTVE
ncbi:capsid cement protein [Pasteurella multocida]|uniref:capsid cement protein n=1 Tax=Pasteurella multocida TaxID=747 RepID=UPI00397AA5DD